MPSSHDNDIRERIRAALRVAGLDIKGLAERCQVPYQTMQAYLTGKRSLPARRVAAIANTLDVSTDWLLTGEPAALHPASLREALMWVHAVIEDHRLVSGDEPTQSELASTFYKAYIEDYFRRLGTGSATEDASALLNAYRLRLRGEY